MEVVWLFGVLVWLKINDTTLVPGKRAVSKLEDAFGLAHDEVQLLRVVAAITHVIGRQVHLSQWLFLEVHLRSMLRLSQRFGKVVQQLETVLMSLKQRKVRPFHLCSEINETRGSGIDGQGAVEASERLDIVESL
jgi:hypothetical protein